MHNIAWDSFPFKFCLCIFGFNSSVLHTMPNLPSSVFWLTMPPCLPFTLLPWAPLLRDALPCTLLPRCSWAPFPVEGSWELWGLSSGAGLLLSGLWGFLPLYNVWRPTTLFPSVSLSVRWVVLNLWISQGLSSLFHVFSPELDNTGLLVNSHSLTGSETKAQDSPKVTQLKQWFATCLRDP